MKFPLYTKLLDPSLPKATDEQIRKDFQEIPREISEQIAALVVCYHHLSTERDFSQESVLKRKQKTFPYDICAYGEGESSVRICLDKLPQDLGDILRRFMAMSLAA